MGVMCYWTFSRFFGHRRRRHRRIVRNRVGNRGTQSIYHAPASLVTSPPPPTTTLCTVCNQYSPVDQRPVD